MGSESSCSLTLEDPGPQLTTSSFPQLPGFSILPPQSSHQGSETIVFLAVSSCPLPWRRDPGVGANFGAQLWDARPFPQCLRIPREKRRPKVTGSQPHSSNLHASPPAASHMLGTSQWVGRLHLAVCHSTSSLHAGEGSCLQTQRFLCCLGRLEGETKGEVSSPRGVPGMFEAQSLGS